MTAPMTRGRRLPRRAFTVADIARMIEAGVIGEDGNFELIEGENVPMSPKYRAHERVKSILGAALARALPDHLLIGFASSIYLSEDTFVEPDLCIYPARLRLEEMKGPDLAIAIEAAASSLAFDLAVKAPLYARHGVREYWVVNAPELTTTIHAGPRPDGGWESVRTAPPEEELRIAALPGFALRLEGIAV